MCHRVQGDSFIEKIDCEGIDYVDKCPGKKPNFVPKLDPVLGQFWHVFLRAVPGLFVPGGGFDFNAIDMVFRYYQVNENEYPILMDFVYATILGIQDVIEMERAKAENG